MRSSRSVSRPSRPGIITSRINRSGRFAVIAQLRQRGLAVVDHVHNEAFALQVVGQQAAQCAVVVGDQDSWHRRRLHGVHSSEGRQ